MSCLCVPHIQYFFVIPSVWQLGYILFCALHSALLCNNFKQLQNKMIKPLVTSITGSTMLMAWKVAAKYPKWRGNLPAHQQALKIKQGVNTKHSACYIQHSTRTYTLLKTTTALLTWHLKRLKLRSAQGAWSDQVQNRVPCRSAVLIRSSPPVRGFQRGLRVS